VKQRDAIGNDILGSYRTLERLGHRPSILSPVIDEEIVRSYNTVRDMTPSRIAAKFDILIYHHCMYWPTASDIIVNFKQGPVVVKYHNITPPSYFAPYSERYEVMCRQGIAQTVALTQNQQVALWLADSNYNRNDLQIAGAPAERIEVVPPFNRTDELVKLRHSADYQSPQVHKFLFIGRRVPNKGHAHLLRVFSAYVDLFLPSALLLIVGSSDAELHGYSDELAEMAEELNIAEKVQWYEHVSDEHLDAFLQTSHVYINCSEHEGFCVPIIESQAVGLPVISMDAAASGETLGDNQLLCPINQCDDDYEVTAGLVHEVMVNHDLRQQVIAHGLRNVQVRFSQSTIESRFVESIVPLLS
jgi:glycosyltransferase involved in cell wall biosynthesis